METKKKRFLGWYFEFNLLFRILIGLVGGALLGIIFKEKILWIAPFGDLFVRLLKMIVMPIIVATLITGAASISPAKLGKIGLRVVGLYLVTSAFAVCIGLLAGSIFRPSAKLAATNIADAAAKSATKVSVSQTLLNIVPTNPFDSMVKGDVLPVIFFAILFGIGVSYLQISEDEHVRKTGVTLLNFFDGVSSVMTKMVNGIMQYAPIGVLALIASVFAKQGAKAFSALGMVTLTALVGDVMHIIVIYMGMVALFGLNPLKFWRQAKNPFITGLVTRSSYGTLPVSMEAAKNLGVPKEVYSFSLPLGATINMDGTAIYEGVCAIFISLSATGHMLTSSQMGTVILTATLASIGTAGVPGAGAIMLLMVLESIGLKVEAGTAIAGAYAMILGIDAILDMGRTSLNVTGDLTCTTCVAKQMGMIDMDYWK
jgi:Na+/H+-dicarboxylate symporter